MICLDLWSAHDFCSEGYDLSKFVVMKCCAVMNYLHIYMRVQHKESRYTHGFGSTEARIYSVKYGDIYASWFQKKHIHSQTCLMEGTYAS